MLQVSMIRAPVSTAPREIQIWLKYCASLISPLHVSPNELGFSQVADYTHKLNSSIVSQGGVFVVCTRRLSPN